LAKCLLSRQKCGRILKLTATILAMNQQPRWVIVLAAAAILLITLRFLPAFSFIFLLLLILAAAGFVAYSLWYYWRSRQEQSEFADTVSGRIQAQLEECEALRQKNELELQDIKSSIQDLEQQKANVSDMTETNRRESERLLKGFYQELKLRQTKNRFFRTAEEKLNSLLHNHQLENQLNEKRQKLLELREDKYEELAELEELRYNLVSDTAYLDTIDDLSQQMKQSESYENASSLEEKLEEMTVKLKKM